MLLQLWYAMPAIWCLTSLAFAWRSDYALEKGKYAKCVYQICRSDESCKFCVRDAFSNGRREYRFLHAHPVRYNAALTLFVLLITLVL